MKYSKACILSHGDDLDGCMSAFNLWLYCLKHHYIMNDTDDIYFTSYGESEEVLNKLIHDEYDLIFVSDLSFKSTKVFENIPPTKMVILIDHHESSVETFEYLNENNTQVIAYCDSSGNNCAADLTFEMLTNDVAWIPDSWKSMDAKLVPWYDDHRMTRLNDYTHSEDLWIKDEPIGIDLSKLMSAVGPYKMFDYIWGFACDENWEDGDIRWEEYDDKNLSLILEIVEKQDRQIEKLASATMFSTDITTEDNTYKLHSLYAYGPYSQIANDAVDDNGGLGWCVVVNPVSQKLSIRTNQATVDKTKIKANQLASLIHPNGGGHPCAGGCAIDFAMIRDINGLHTKIVNIITDLLS